MPCSPALTGFRTCHDLLCQGHALPRDTPDPVERGICRHAQPQGFIRKQVDAAQWHPQILRGKPDENFAFVIRHGADKHVALPPCKNRADPVQAHPGTVGDIVQGVRRGTKHRFGPSTDDGARMAPGHRDHSGIPCHNPPWRGPCQRKDKHIYSRQYARFDHHSVTLRPSSLKAG